MDEVLRNTSYFDEFTFFLSLEQLYSNAISFSKLMTLWGYKVWEIVNYPF